MIATVIRAVILCFVLVYVGFPLMRASQHYKDAMVIAPCVPLAHGAAVSPTQDGLCRYEGALDYLITGEPRVTLTSGEKLMFPLDKVPGIITHGSGYTAWTYVAGTAILATLLLLLFPWTCLLPSRKK